MNESKGYGSPLEDSSESSRECFNEPGSMPLWRAFLTNINAYTLVTGIVPMFILLATVGTVLYGSLATAGLSRSEIISWLVAIHVVAGTGGILLAFRYRQPISAAYSIPGIAIMAAALGNNTYSDVLGGALIAGVLVLIGGITGLISKLLKVIPMSIMQAMIAGILISFPLQLIDGFNESVSISLSAVVGYVVFYLLIPRLPGICGALLFGTIAAIIMRDFSFSAVEFGLGEINIYAPTITFSTVLSVSIPLAIVVIGSENMTAIAALQNAEYRPPVTAMTIFSGLGGVLVSLFGGHNANIAGPGTAAITGEEAGPHSGRFVAGVFSSATVLTFGIFAPVVASVFDAFPSSLLFVLIALVLIPVVGSMLVGAWSNGTLQFGCMIAFIVSVSGLEIAGISAAFWSLLFGCLTSLVLEFDNYRQTVRTLV